MNSLAIKLDVSDDNQKDLNNLLIKVGIKPQRRYFHCTVGFLDKAFESVQEAEEFVELVKPHLSLESPISFTYTEPRFLFRHVIALVPETHALHKMRDINLHLHKVLQKLVDDKYALNPQTTGEGFHPHITLWRQRHKDRRFRQLREELNEGRLPCLELVKYSYTIL